MKFLHWFIVIGFIILLYGLAFGEEKRPRYRPHTPEELINLYNIKAIDEMVSSLQKTSFAAQLQEALNCPCYDIQISTDNKQTTFIQIDKGRCDDVNDYNEKRKGQD